MTHSEILSHIDHTLLRPTSTWEEIKVICEDALKYRTASVCIPPCYVKRAKEAYPQLNVCTVIGFPLGYCVTEVKVCEAKQAIAEGASEIDMVINVCDVKNGDFDRVSAEIGALRRATEGSVLKVIIETCYLTEQEKIRLCEIITEQKADFIKTSTGFGTAGAKLEDIQLFKRHIGPDVKMKAAGGVKTAADLEAFLGEGCERIGTSSAVKILAGEAAQGY
ncbi:deoxyribose-phosphate aldolase [Feifania hominis]|uniref:Deoxyribose-phosphate aldolase n=1 Tax=Feifania hominis TaxID=2763660 RepID=A0A926DBA0_9FIRM|nr:deoxyribose-phosphate aldolase [Feifania hominis]MBC8535358.1 deoxyribose-phosphate aldolase [Feifania hominis]